MLYPAPILSEDTPLLPVYLFTAGENYPQEERFRPNGAPFHHLFFVLEGQLQLELPQGTFCYPAGTALFLPKHLRHRYRSAGGRLLTGWLTFDGSAVDNLFSYFKISGVCQADAAPLIPQYQLCVQAVRKGQNHVQLSALFYPLLLLFFSQLEQTASHLQRAKALIAAQAVHDLSVSDIAQAVGISPSLLYRLFAQDGSTPLSYLHTCRIEQAKNLLLRTRDTVDAIGTQCGFHDCSYFCKMFRRLVGLSPNEFRKKYG